MKAFLIATLIAVPAIAHGETMTLVERASPAGKIERTQAISFASGASSSEAYGDQTNSIAVTCDVKCAVRTKYSCAGDEAVAGNEPLEPGASLKISVQPGDCLSVVRRQ